MMRQMNPESLKGMASLLQQYGRNGDTILAHINPREAMLLNNVTDGGSMNPMTGMPEFFEGLGSDDTDGGDAGGAVGGAGDPGGDPGGNPGDDDPGGMGGAENMAEFGGYSPSGDDSGGQEMDDFDPDGYAYADEFSMSMDPSQNAQLSDDTGLGFGDTRTAADMGIGSLMPDSPGIMEILTAPLETLVNLFTFGLVDMELTGKDVFGVPGMSSSDFSRGMAGLQGPQPVGVEIGLPGIGGLSFSKDGVDTYGGPITNFLNEAFSSKFAIENPGAKQAAAEKVMAAKEIANRGKTQAPENPALGYARNALTNTNLNAPPSLGYAGNALTNTNLNALTNTNVNAMNAARNQANTFAPANTIPDTNFQNVGVNLNRAGGVGVPLGVNPVGPNLGVNPVGVPLGVNPVGVNLGKNPVGVPLGVNPVGVNLNTPSGVGVNLGKSTVGSNSLTPNVSSSSTSPGSAQAAYNAGLGREVGATVNDINMAQILGKSVEEVVAERNLNEVTGGFGRTNARGEPVSRFAQGGAVSLNSLYNNVRARRGPVTGGQRSGGIMSLR